MFHLGLILKIPYKGQRFRSSHIPKKLPPLKPKNSHFLAKKDVEFLRQRNRRGNKEIKESQATKELKHFLKNLENSTYVRNKCLKLGIEPEIWDKAARQFKIALMEDELDYIDLDTIVKHHLNGESFDRTVVPYLFKFIQQNFDYKKNKLFDNLVLLSELKNPGKLYPEARKMKRNIILHVGPTNSGKTYHALKKFKDSDSAIYCGPLRLLAHEVYEKCNAENIACNLLTGEERKESDNVNRWSSTVEMASTSRKFDLAVLDEIQMISDPQRGWAWTQAFYGIQAKELHLCGEPSAVNLIRKLCESTGEECEVRTYERLTGLQLDPKSLSGNLAKVERGDCIVAFSRKEIFQIKNYIEKNTKLKAAVIYGNLPPESRSEQARLFNDPNSKLSVLVASDAIGMGLNLNIKRIIFTKFKKFNGKEEALISLSQGKQIAGRAGRFGTQWENGLVTSLHSHSIPILKSYLNETPEELNSAGISPQIEQLEKFARVLPNLSFSRLLQQFEQLATVDGDFFLCNVQQQIEAAQLIENVQLSLRDKYVFIQAPCNTRDETLTSYLHEFATSHSMGHTINADRLLNIFPRFNEEKLAHLEVFHRAIMLYLWLSNRFPETFHEAEKVHQFKNKIEGAINQKLMRGNLKTRNQNQDSHNILEPIGTFKQPNPSTRKREDEY